MHRIPQLQAPIVAAAVGCVGVQVQQPQPGTRLHVQHLVARTGTARVCLVMLSLLAFTALQFAFRSDRLSRDTTRGMEYVSDSWELLVRMVLGIPGVHYCAFIVLPTFSPGITGISSYMSPWGALVSLIQYLVIDTIPRVLHAAWPDKSNSVFGGAQVMAAYFLYVALFYRGWLSHPAVGQVVLPEAGRTGSALPVRCYCCHRCERPGVQRALRAARERRLASLSDVILSAPAQLFAAITQQAARLTLALHVAHEHNRVALRRLFAMLALGTLFGWNFSLSVALLFVFRATVDKPHLQLIVAILFFLASSVLKAVLLRVLRLARFGQPVACTGLGALLDRALARLACARTSPHSRVRTVAPAEAGRKGQSVGACEAACGSTSRVTDASESIARSHTRRALDLGPMTPGSARSIIQTRADIWKPAGSFEQLQQQPALSQLPAHNQPVCHTASAISPTRAPLIAAKLSPQADGSIRHDAGPYYPGLTKAMHRPSSILAVDDSGPLPARDARSAGTPTAAKAEPRPWLSRYASTAHILTDADHEPRELHNLHQLSQMYDPPASLEDVQRGLSIVVDPLFNASNERIMVFSLAVVIDLFSALAMPSSGNSLVFAGMLLMSAGQFIGARLLWLTALPPEFTAPLRADPEAVTSTIGSESKPARGQRVVAAPWYSDLPSCCSPLARMYTALLERTSPVPDAAQQLAMARHMQLLLSAQHVQAASETAAGRCIPLSPAQDPGARAGCEGELRLDHPVDVQEQRAVELPCVSHLEDLVPLCRRLWVVSELQTAGLLLFAECLAPLTFMVIYTLSLYPLTFRSNFQRETALETPYGLGMVYAATTFVVMLLVSVSTAVYTARKLGVGLHYIVAPIFSDKAQLWHLFLSVWAVLTTAWSFLE